MREDGTGWPGTPWDSPPERPTDTATDTPTDDATGLSDPGTGQNPGPDRVLSPEDEQKALDLAAAGVSYRRIGKLLGVSKNTAWRTVQRAYADHHDERWNSLKEFVARESVRLDRMDSVWLPKALKGEVNAAVIVLRTQTARLRLAAAAGLTSPSRQQGVTVPGGNNSVIDQEIMALVSKLEANASQVGPPRE